MLKTACTLLALGATLASAAHPESIRFKMKAASFPEGVEYDSVANQFIVSSFTGISDTLIATVSLKGEVVEKIKTTADVGPLIFFAIDD